MKKLIFDEIWRHVTFLTYDAVGRDLTAQSAM